MKLRTKLLLGVGLLLFFMAIIMYIMPTFFIRKDVYWAAEEIHQLLITDHQKLVQSQKNWLENIVSFTKQNNNALLFMVYEDPPFSSKLIFEGNEAGVVWSNLARLIGYDPAIAFVQTHSPNVGKSGVIAPHAATLYPFKLDSHDSGQGHVDIPYRAIRLPLKMQVEPRYILYGLFPPEVDENRVVEELESIKSESKAHVPKINELAEKEKREATPSFLWSIKVDLIRILTPLFIAQESLSSAPLGLASLDERGNGYAILSKEVFSTTPFFDDVLYYKEQAPLNPPPPLAQGGKIFTRQQDHSAYLTNTLFFDQSYLSVGASLNVLARQLALSSNKMILLKVGSDFWLGFSEKGIPLSEKKISEIIYSEDFKNQSGTLTLDNGSFFFSPIVTLNEGEMIFYDFHPLGGENSIVSTLMSLEEKLTKRIALQLSLISLATMILVLLFVGRIGFTVIHPITKLAMATQDVVAGRYGEVVLPEMRNRQDEVAILTRSFADMVKGLEERERIRGVLDKVVSKDVADEILRTHIHLGGEDRIVSMLFGDIRGFTQLTSEFNPQDTIHMLNLCMTRISRVIEGEGGVIDKYVGDEVMAIFGAPNQHPDHALRAVSSGVLIIEFLKQWNQERVSKGERPIEMGIGVHSGLVVAGNMGAENRLNYTVLGANVNLAARLCEEAKPNQLIISAATLAEPNIQASFYATPLEPLSLKGFGSPIPIYEITGFKWE